MRGNPLLTTINFFPYPSMDRGVERIMLYRLYKSDPMNENRNGEKRNGGESPRSNGGFFPTIAAKLRRPYLARSITNYPSGNIQAAILRKSIAVIMDSRNTKGPISNTIAFARTPAPASAFAFAGFAAPARIIAFAAPVDGRRGAPAKVVKKIPRERERLYARIPRILHGNAPLRLYRGIPTYRYGSYTLAALKMDEWTMGFIGALGGVGVPAWGQSTLNITLHPRRGLGIIYSDSYVRPRKCTAKADHVQSIPVPGHATPSIINSRFRASIFSEPHPITNIRVDERKRWFLSDHPICVPSYASRVRSTPKRHARASLMCSSMHAGLISTHHTHSTDCLLRGDGGMHLRGILAKILTCTTVGIPAFAKILTCTTVQNGHPLLNSAMHIRARGTHTRSDIPDEQPIMHYCTAIAVPLKRAILHARTRLAIRDTILQTKRQGDTVKCDETVILPAVAERRATA